MRTFGKLLFVGFFFLLSSCGGINKIVRGFWTISTIEYQGENIFYDLLSNIIIFEREKCSIPTFPENHKIKLKNGGIWNITKRDGQYFLTITDTENEIFAGTHKICLEKHLDKKLITLVISSEKLYIECQKGLFNFYKDHKTIDDYLCK